MADTKITALTALTGADPANDVIPIVDVSDTTMAASGTTKKISVNNILGASGTATLASATITGDLTVDTSTLKVDSANDRVGIGTATPGSRLDVRFATNPVIDNAVPTNALRVFTSVAQAIDVGGQIGLGGLYNATDFQAFGNISGKKENSTSGNNAGYLVFGTCNSGGTMAERYRIDSTGISTWSVGGSTAMTLNSTGLGVGDTPASNTRLTVAAASRLADSTGQAYIHSTDAQAQDIGAQLTLGGLYNASAHYAFGGIAGRKENSTSGNVAGYLDLLTTTSAGALTSRMRIDSSGNVGIGVTPSVYQSWGSPILQLKGAGTIISSNRFFYAGSNYYYEGGSYKYIESAAAAYYAQSAGSHIWYNESGTKTAGQAFTWNAAAMTLDASGRLLVAKTTSATGSTGCELQTGAGGNSASVFTADGAFASIMNRLTSDGIIVDLRRQTLSVGNISVTTTGATFNSTSDYRLKEAVQPLVGGLARVSALKPSIYKWKADGSSGEGFLAHELAEVVPAAVSGEKDAVNEDGSIKPQGVDMSRVVPVLVAAIQELTAEVNALKNA